MSRFMSDRGRQQVLAFVAAVAVGLGVVATPQAATADLCFNQPGVTACVAPEFRTFWEQNGGTTTVAGIDFMKATWKVWLGNIDPPSLGDRLIANL